MNKSHFTARALCTALVAFVLVSPEAMAGVSVARGSVAGLTGVPVARVLATTAAGASVRPPHSSAQVDTAELQWSLCEKEEATVFRKLDVDGGSPSERDVYYSDTSDLALYQQGAILRSRITKNKIKTAAKVRALDENKIPWDFLADKDYKCEVDAYLEKSGVACSVNYKPGSELRLYSSEQATWIQKMVGFQDFAKLKVLGPASSREWQWEQASLKNTLVLESVRAPKSFLSMELSLRVPRAEVSRVQSQVSAWLKLKQITLCEKQSGKTSDLLQALRP